MLRGEATGDWPTEPFQAGLLRVVLLGMPCGLRSRRKVSLPRSWVLGKRAYGRVSLRLEARRGEAVILRAVPVALMLIRTDVVRLTVPKSSLQIKSVQKRSEN